METNGWLGSLEHELKGNILSYWMKHTVDDANGGFFGELAADSTARPDAGRSLVLNTRILWTFAAAYRIYQDEQYRRMAERAHAYLTDHFLDGEAGGYVWMIDAKGLPTDRKKQVYGQAFAIYALSELYRATGVGRALEQAVDLFRLLEKYACDPVHDGYAEAFTQKWEPLNDYSLSHHGIHADKTMNTHLHVLEAYTNLYRVWPDPGLAARLKALIGLTAERIVNNRTYHFSLFFDEAWTPQSDHVSYGHDIEGSWLLVEAAEALTDEALLRSVRETAVRMAEAVLEQGTDTDGGLWNESDGTTLVDRNKDWWPQAEAMVGFYNAYQLTGEARFLAAAQRSWLFIDSCLVDKAGGEWFERVSEDGKPLPGTKVSAWKCPYHNSRACFELIERLGRHPVRSHA